MPDAPLLWPTLLLAAASVILAAGLIALAVGQRRRQREWERLAQEARTLRGDLGALVNGAVGVSERVARLEQQMRRLTERQDQLELSGVETRPYEHAIDLALKGATAGDLVKECGLTPGEAELVVMMHRIEQG